MKSEVVCPKRRRSGIIIKGFPTAEACVRSCDPSLSPFTFSIAKKYTAGIIFKIVFLFKQLHAFLRVGAVL